MKFNRPVVLVTLIALTVLSKAGAAPAASDPVKVTSALYQSAKEHFGFSEETVKLQKQWLEPELYARLIKEANKPVLKGDAPDIEGDLFYDSQESPSGYEIGKSTIDHDKAKVGVTVKIPGEKRHYTVLLKQVDGLWKVYDVNYGKDGSLTDLLK